MAKQPAWETLDKSGSRRLRLKLMMIYLWKSDEVADGYNVQIHAANKHDALRSTRKAVVGLDSAKRRAFHMASALLADEGDSVERFIMYDGDNGGDEGNNELPFNTSAQPEHDGERAIQASSRSEAKAEEARRD